MFKSKHVRHLLTFAFICLAVFQMQITDVRAELVQLRNDDGTAATYYDGWQAGNVVGAVLTPDANWTYPLRIDSVEFMLYQFSGAAGSATISVHVYSTINGAPGTLLASSSPHTVTTFWPDWTSIDLTSINVTLPSAEPFIIAIEYTAGTSNSTPATLNDSQTDVPAGKNFYSLNGGATWYEHYDFWTVPEDVGHSMIRATVNPGWTFYLPGVASNWTPPTPTATPIPPPPPDPSDLPCLYALNWWRDDSPPYPILRSPYSPPCLQGTAEVENVFDGTGRQTGYSAAVERQGKLDFGMDAVYFFNAGGGVEGADVIKTYVGGHQYALKITQFCPKVGQLVGYRVRVYAPPYDGQEVTVGSCP